MGNLHIHKLRDDIKSKFLQIDKIASYPIKESYLNDMVNYEIVKNNLKAKISKRINILYVDDEENNLVSFLASFRHDYNIFLAHTIDIAIDILKREEINVVITDQRMPHLTGIQFLKKIQTIFEKPPIFMLISAYNDFKNLSDIVNGVNIFKYLNKPFDVEIIKNSISNAYLQYHTN